MTKSKLLLITTYLRANVKCISSIALGIFLCSIFSPESSARPRRPPETIDCSFNNSIERCSYTQDTDGSILLVWPGGVKVFYDCGRYKDGVGEVGFEGKDFAATCKVTQNRVTFNTSNGITKFQLPRYAIYGRQ